MTIVGLDPAAREGPPAVRDARIAALMEFRRRFNITLQAGYRHGALLLRP